MQGLPYADTPMPNPYADPAVQPSGTPQSGNIQINPANPNDALRNDAGIYPPYPFKPGE